MLPTEEDTTTPQPESALEEHLFSVVLSEVVTGNSKKGVLQLIGVIQQVEVSILIDSGSTHSFVSQFVLPKFASVVLQETSVSVKVANGNLMQCTSQWGQAELSIQDYLFHQDLKVLPIQSYDLILGMDWLENHSPMEIHWRQKWLSITYQGTTVCLFGAGHNRSEDLLIHIPSVSYPEVKPSAPSLLPEVAILLDKFPGVVSAPTALPPSRPCDHSIPLIAGARPVSVRPYRYSPSLKDEIEKQVNSMLQQGLIRPSSSSFSSPVLLVRKKDGSYRFCVDYRYLNALTVKSKFPIPIFDQLIDELAGASWFSTLDLISGYHQVRLQPGEEFKTAFQTHTGHFEFVVMPFGLSGAPGTFQNAMNTTLASLLRKCVLVFFDDILVYSKSFGDHLEHLAAVFQLLQ